MLNYYIQGLGYHPIDPKHLPSETCWINKIELLDLYILKLSDNIWVQKNYVSGKIRVIIKTKTVQEVKDVEEQCNVVNLVKIQKLFENVDAILDKQQELIQLFSACSQ